LTKMIFDLTTGLERTERYMCRYKRIGDMDQADDIVGLIMFHNARSTKYQKGIGVVNQGITSSYPGHTHMHHM
jgi:hypothetical protein